MLPKMIDGQILEFLEWGDRQKGWAPSTLHGHRSHLTQLAKWLTGELGHEPGIADVTTQLCERWGVVRERAGVRPAGRFADVCSIRAFGVWGVTMGLITENPGKLLKLPHLDEPIQKSCTENEKLLLLDAAARRLKSPTDRAQFTAILSTFLHAGPRRFELLALNISDIQFSDDPRRCLIVIRRGKGRKRREVPINSVLLGHLQAWLGLRYPQEPGTPRTSLVERLKGLPVNTPLWMGFRRARMSDGMLTRVITDVRIAAGLAESDNLTPHGFRHYFATELDRAGVPLKEIQTLLGHSQIETTLSYLQSHREHLFDAVERLSRPAPLSAPTAEPDRIRRAVTTHRKAAFRRQ